MAGSSSRPPQIRYARLRGTQNIFVPASAPIPPARTPCRRRRECALDARRAQFRPAPSWQFSCIPPCSSRRCMHTAIVVLLPGRSGRSPTGVPRRARDCWHRGALRRAITAEFLVQFKWPCPVGLAVRHEDRTHRVTATSAPTTRPSCRSREADPMPPLRNPANAPRPAPTDPKAKSDCAISDARSPRSR